MNVNKSLVNQIVNRIKEICSPVKIILFGSAAKGEMHENSDLDFLVIVSNGTHRRKTAQMIYKNLIDVGFAADIIVVTEEDVETYKDFDGTVIKPALTEGNLIYDARFNQIRAV